MRNKEIDDFLEKVDAVTNQINDISKGNFDEQSYNTVMEKLGDKNAGVKTAAEKIPDKITRREGKGEKRDYSDFCVYCSVEYLVHQPICDTCGKRTMPCEARVNYINDKVEEMKLKRKSKEERKKRWELWKQTRTMNKQSKLIDYDKWYNYTDSEDSEEEALKSAERLPSDDPNFKALEKDINERQERIKADRLKAAKHKAEGNKHFKERRYEQAIAEYTLALDLDRSNKALWLNRALAYNKLEKYTDAVANCSSVLEYCEVLEDGYEKSKDWVLKALLRRAFAYKQLKKYDEAAKDCETGLSLLGSVEDKEFKELHSQIKTAKAQSSLLNSSERFEQLSDDQISLLKRFEGGIGVKPDDFIQTTNLIQANSQFQLLFCGSNAAIKTLGAYIRPAAADVATGDNSEQERLLAMSGALGLVQAITELDNETYEDVLIQEGIFTGIVRFINQVADNVSRLAEVEVELLEALVCVVEGSKRKTLRKHLLHKSEVLLSVFDKTIEVFRQSLAKAPKATPSGAKISQGTLYGAESMLLKLFGNLFYKEEEDSYTPTFKKEFYQKYNEVLVQIIMRLEEKHKNGIEVLASLYSMYSNLFANKWIRTHFRSKFKAFGLSFSTQLCHFLDRADEQRWRIDGLAGNVLSFYLNLSFDQNACEVSEIVDQSGLSLYFVGYAERVIDSADPSLLNRLLLLLEKSENLPEAKCASLLKTLVQTKLEALVVDKQHNNLAKFFIKQSKRLPRAVVVECVGDVGRVLSVFAGFLAGSANSKEDVVAVNNSIVLLTTLVEIEDKWTGQMHAFIAPLTQVIKEKTGALRKSAAILLAKLCKDPANLEKARELHATKVLMSLAGNL